MTLTDGYYTGVVALIASGWQAAPPKNSHETHENGELACNDVRYAALKIAL